MDMYICMDMYVFMYVFVCMYVYMDMYICMYEWMDMYIYTHTYIYIYIYIQNGNHFVSSDTLKISSAPLPVECLNEQRVFTNT